MNRLSVAHWAIVLTSFLFASCALSFRPYSETRDKQGQSIAESTKDVSQSMNSSFVIARENNDALLKQEEETDTQVEAARRDSVITTLVWGSVGSQLSTPVNIELANLAGPNANEYLTSLDTIDAADKVLAYNQASLRGTGVTIPDCESLLNPAGNKGAGPEFVVAHGTCVVRQNAEAAANSALSNAAGSLIVDTINKRKEQQASLDKTKAITASYRAAFIAAKKDYEDAATAYLQNPEDEGLRARVQDLGKKLKSLVATLEKADDAFSKRFISDERRKAIDDFFSALTSSPDKPIPEGTSKAAMALILFPSTIDNTRDEIEKANQYPLAGLVLRRQYAETQYDAQTADIALSEEKITLFRTKQSLQEIQARQYLKAQTGLAGLSTQEKNLTIMQVLGEAPSKKSNSAVNEKVYQAAGRYIYARTKAQRNIDDIDQKIHAIEYRRQIAYSEANAEQWNTLISSNAAQLSAYGASGIRPDMILALFNSLMLLAIAIGTNL